MASMKISRSSIPEGGLPFTFCGRDASWQGLAGIQIHAAPSGHLRVQRKGTEIIIDGRVRAVLGFACSRCLEPFQYPVDVSFHHLLRPGGIERVEAKEIELSAEDLEYGTYEGDTIELDRIVEEHVILSLPMKPLCREDCRGLCPRCGANRNEEPCTCHGAIRVSPFDSLKDIMISK